MIPIDVADLPAKAVLSTTDYVLIVDNDDASRFKRASVSALPSASGATALTVADTATIDLTYAAGVLSGVVFDNSISPIKLSFDPATQVELDAHTTNLTNPHVVTKTQVGLSLVPNVDASVRANHTGTQLAATVSDFSGAVDARVSALVLPGTGVTKAYDATAHTLTIGTVYQPLVQTVLYATTITVDAALGTLVKVGPLTGPITIAAPVNPVEGWSLVYYLKQDAIGGRAVTWNGVFRNLPIIDSTAPANAQDLVAFVYVDSAWVRSRV